MDKHLYTDGTDTVIATSIEDAEKIWGEWTGGSHHADESEEPFVQVPDDENFSVLFEEFDGLPGTNGTIIPTKALIDRRSIDNEHDISWDVYDFRVSALAKDWAACNEPHFLCSSEY